MSAALQKNGPEVREHLPSRVLNKSREGQAMNPDISTMPAAAAPSTVMIAAGIVSACNAKLAMDSAAGRAKDCDFDVLVDRFDHAVKDLASAPCTCLEDARMKAKFLLLIDRDDQGNHLRDMSFVARFLAELAGDTWTDADEARFREDAA